MGADGFRSRELLFGKTDPMCINCWKEAGSPSIDNEKVRTAIRLINALYELHSAGGLGHVVFDDWNVLLAEGCVIDCDDPDALKNVDADTAEMSRVALVYFCNLSEHERYSTLAQRDGLVNISI